MARNGRRTDGDSSKSDSGSNPPSVVSTTRGDSASSDGVGGVGGGSGGADGTGSAIAGDSNGSTGSGGVSAIDSGHSVDASTDSSGTGTVAGSDGDGSGDTGRAKRGRPRKDASDGASVVGASDTRVRRTRAPKEIGLGALGLGGERGGNMSDAYISGSRLVFAIPKYAGLGDHWSLDDDEAQDMARAVQAFVKSLPKTQRSRWEKRLEKYWPGINLAMVAGMITVPRVVATVALARMQHEQQLSPSPVPVSQYGAESIARQDVTRIDTRDLVERSTSAHSGTNAAIDSGSVGEIQHADGIASV